MFRQGQRRHRTSSSKHNKILDPRRPVLSASSTNHEKQTIPDQHHSIRASSSTNSENHDLNNPDPHRRIRESRDSENVKILDRGGSSNSESGSENCMSPDEMRQVMSGLVSVLDGLRSVVGNIKSLVTHIDHVTDKLQNTSHVAARDGSDPEAGVHPTADHDRSFVKHKTTCFHRSKSMSASCSIESFYESIPATESPSDGLPGGCDGSRLLSSSESPQAAGCFVRSGSGKSGRSKSGKKLSRKHEYVNIVIGTSTRRSEALNGLTTSAVTTHQHDYVNLDEFERFTSIDSGWFSSNNVRRHETKHGASTKDKPQTGRHKSGSSRQKMSREKKGHAGISSSEFVKNNNGKNPEPESDPDADAQEEYSGVYEKEMEDSLELEGDESRDPLAQAVSDSSSFSSESHQDSEDFADWERMRQRRLDATVKFADIVAWTKSSWTGKNVYHVSLDHSMGHSVPATAEGTADDAQQWLKLV